MYTQTHTYMYTHTHTPCFHVIASNIGRKAYINMFFKTFLEHEILLLLLGSTGLFGNSFQNAAFGEKYFTNQSDSLKAYFAMIAFTRVGGRGKFCFISLLWIPICPFLDV